MKYRNLQEITDADSRLAIWKIANDIRATAGKNELLMADWRDFFEQFAQSAIEFDAPLSDAVADRKALEDEKLSVEARIHDANLALELLQK